MTRLVCVIAVVAGIAAAVGAAAPQRPLVQPRTLLTTKSPITQFAQDGSWLAWTTARESCGRRVHLLSLRTRREVRIDRPSSGVGCIDGTLALAGGRVAWPSVTGHGNTEVDFAITSASAWAPKPRRVRAMVRFRDDYEPEPPLPPLAGRGSVIAYYRNDEGFGEPAVRAVERIFGGKPKRVFQTADADYLAVDRGRIAAVGTVVLHGDACGCNFEPSWSPDGSRIAFVSGQPCCVDAAEQAKSDIYVMNSDGGGRMRVTSDGLAKFGVTWSPDGKRLAYGYYNAAFVAKIAVVAVDGSGRHDIGDGTFPSWSPDGTKLAFQGRSGVVVADTDGSNARTVANGGRPAWSPDGSHLAYEGGGDLFTVRPDGSDRRRLAAGLTAPAWAPNGAAIAASGRRGIEIVRLGGSRTRLSGAMRGDGNPSWSPDGSRILFDSIRNDLDGDYLYEPEIYVVNADGSGRPLPITFQLEDEWYSRVEVRSLYGRLLAVRQVYGAPLGLALDGRYAAILVQPARSAQKQLQVVDARTGSELRAIQVPSSARGPLSASGGRVVFAAGQTVRLVSLPAGETRLLAFARGRIVGVAISGRRVTWAETTGKRSGRIRQLLLPR